ncbi:MAG: hypothetical protein JSR82_23090 [Verrucomicrobia bacterium]|nr:hypothetical protein [Verrucomicrobiota bacterium]
MDFPVVDPIPLPAPVWLFKALHIVTLALHFTAVHLLLGGLLVAVAFAASSDPARRGAAAAIARRLTVVMTYVINFGVPPLLFAQVLYGRALYTSTVLVGAWWIALIPILILCYWLLYQFAERAAAGRSAWWLGLLSWVLAALVAKVFSVNLALMVRPEDWSALYRQSPLGAHLPGDPTLLPRLLFMFAAAFTTTGCWFVWLAARRSISDDVQRVLRSNGAWLALLGTLAQGFIFPWLLARQPAAVQELLAKHGWLPATGWAWGALAAVVAVVALRAFRAAQPPAPLYASLLAVLAFLPIAVFTVFRDGLRDLTLLTKGFDVWQRAVVANWSVVATFLLTFVLGLAAVGWLISVFVRATPHRDIALP